MILFYIDESGTGLSDKRSAFFVLAATSISIDDWPELDNRFTVLKRRLISFAKPEDFELKGRDLRRGEKFFKHQSWPMRAQAINDIAQFISESPLRVLAVQADKRDLPETIGSDVELYRLTFWRLLDEIDGELRRLNERGMLMVDMRSDMHSSVQDRRLIDAYREWIGSRGSTRLVDVPWFGFSAFYAGLQIADFTAYLIDFVTNEIVREERKSELHEAFQRLKQKIRLIRIP
jgi:hypothetical protein